MSIKIEKGEIKIDVDEFLRALDDEQRDYLSKATAFDSKLIDATAQCAVDGHWDNGDEAAPWWIGGDFVMKLRERLLPLMNEVARELCLDLIQARDQAKAQEKRLDRWAWDLYHGLTKSTDRDSCEYRFRDTREARAEMERLWAERGPPEGKTEPPKKLPEDNVPW